MVTTLNVSSGLDFVISSAILFQGLLIRSIELGLALSLLSHRGQRRKLPPA